MMTPITFFAPGLPKGQPRVKASRFGGFTRVYTPGSADEWKAAIAIAARPHIPAVKLSVPLSVNITVYFPRPKGHYRKDGTLKPNAPKWCPTKPDRDNVDKAVLDILTNIGMWTDDSIACTGSVSKLYANGETGAQIEIKEAE